MTKFCNGLYSRTNVKYICFCELMISNGHMAQVKYFLALTMLLDQVFAYRIS